jgi:glycine cleavage system H protein
MSEEMLNVSVNKFTFLIPKPLLYSEAGVWVRVEGHCARLGLSDYAQQLNGDIAFAKAKAIGAVLESGDDFADIETVKVNVSLPSPVKGTIVEINASLEEAAELINQDPYGKGWLVAVQMADWERERSNLLDAEAYCALVKRQAEAEMQK